MTDRIKGFYVALEENVREDDAEPIMNAVSQLRGVLAVEPLRVESADWVATQRVRNELVTRLFEVLKPPSPKVE